MKCERNKNRSLLNKLLIFLGITCIVFATFIIAMCLDKAEISFFAQGADYIKTSYASTEDTSSTNTWDISENADGSVIATLDGNGILTISGTGNMKNNDIIPVDSVINKIKSVKIENGISNIGDFIFVGFSNLINVEIPSSVTSIGINPFVDCINLININVDSNNAKYKDENGVLYTKDNAKIIAYPAGKTKTEYTILNGTTTICEYAFEYCANLTNIKIPNSVSNIEEGAFWFCLNLTEIEIPIGVTSIKDMTFEYCESLTSVQIPNGVTTIGYDAFAGCYSLESIEIPNSVISIGEDAFACCESLINIYIPSSVTEIGAGAFKYCEGLMGIEISSNITSIGEDAFDGCKIVNLVNSSNKIIELPNVLKRAKNEEDILYSSQDFTFTNCTSQDQQIIINEGFTYGMIEVNDGKLRGLTYIISNNTWDISEKSDGTLIATLDENGLMKISGSGDVKDFMSFKNFPWYYINTVIRNVKIEEGVTKLNLSGFNYCINLKNIQIPSTVVSLGEDKSYILYQCYKLTYIIVNSNNTKYSDYNGVLYSKDKKELISYPSRKKEDKYKILEGVERIREEAFANTYYLKEVEIPSTLKSMENYAFRNCIGLKNVIILEGITSIDQEAFFYCENLEKIIIPTTVTEIGEKAFKHCDNVTIVCEKNSFAETYAKENEIPYQIIYLSSTESKIDEINLMIKNIQPQTTIQDIKSGLSSEISYIILDSKGNEIQDVSTIIGTGCTIKLENNTIYTIIINGDANGDGKADIRDILAINKHRLNKADLTSQYVQAGDVNEDENADIRDILQINKFRLGKITEL